MRRRLLQQGLPPLAARVLSARDIAHCDDIIPPLSSLPPPDFLPDIKVLCDILEQAISKQEKICIVGDYDADGMCATALAADGLHRLGAEVIWRIPERMRHGYGLHSDIAEEAAAEGAAILLTVDNGTSATAAVAKAKSLGLKVCITDHHLPGDSRPDADCLVNPNLTPGSPGANLCGTGVVFYALAALRSRLDAELKMSGYLDLVALATVADCMPMDSLNRALVGGGLRMLRGGGGRKGIRALAAAAKLNLESAGCRDISHAIAPRLNAAGRFDRADLGVECLLADSDDSARKAAAKIDAFNHRRKEEVERIMAEAESKLSKSKTLPPGIVVRNADWLPGVTGIVASRLVERHQCPAIVFCQCNGLWRGSGRAPSGWDLHCLTKTAGTMADIFGAASDSNSDSKMNSNSESNGEGMLNFNSSANSNSKTESKTESAEQVGDSNSNVNSQTTKRGAFGGHRRAVGITIADEDIEKFALAFAECCGRAQSAAAAEPQQVDAPPPPDEITAEGVACLEAMVWGELFPRPLFAGDFAVSQRRSVGRRHLTMLLSGGDGLELPAIAFNIQNVGDQIRALFTLSIDSRRGGIMAVIESADY